MCAPVPSKSIVSPSCARRTCSFTPFHWSAGLRQQQLELVVGVVRIVVEEHDRAHLGLARERHRVLDARVAPTDVVRVLLVAVLRVVEQHVDIACDVVAADPLARLLVQVDPEGGLVVGEVGERAPTLLDAVADRGPLVRHLAGPNGRRADRHALLGGVMEGDPRRDVDQPDREQRGREIDGDALGQALYRRGRPPEMDLGAGDEERTEEPEPLQMIEMQMGEEDVQLARGLGAHGDAQRAQSGAGVEDERVPALEPDLQARGVAAVADRLGAWRGQRTTASPDVCLHQAFSPVGATSQNTDTTPCISFVVPNNGYAVASTRRRTPS